MIEKQSSRLDIRIKQKNAVLDTLMTMFILVIPLVFILNDPSFFKDAGGAWENDVFFQLLGERWVSTALAIGYVIFILIFFVASIWWLFIRHHMIFTITERELHYAFDSSVLKLEVNGEVRSHGALSLPGTQHDNEAVQREMSELKHELNTLQTAHDQLLAERQENNEKAKLSKDSEANDNIASETQAKNDESEKQKKDDD